MAQDETPVPHKHQCIELGGWDRSRTHDQARELKRGLQSCNTAVGSKILSKTVQAV